MNRILVYVRGCDRQRRRLRAAKRAAAKINRLVGETVECSYRPLADDGDHRLHFFITADIEPCGDYANAAAHLAAELRIVADQCLVAAETLEGGAA